MRQVRRFAAWLGILAILFAQGALAVYACPALAQPAAGATAAEAPAMPCAEMDAAAPNLCERHCHGEDQQPGTPAVVLPAFFAIFVVAPPQDAATPLASRGAEPPRPAESPPIAFRHRFRL